MVYYLGVYKVGITWEGEPHNDPYITDRVVIYGFSTRQVNYSVDQCLQGISPGDYVILAEFEGSNRLQVKSISEVLSVLTPNPSNGNQIRIPVEKFKGDEEEARKWAYEIIESLPLGLKEREDLKKAFDPGEPTFAKHRLLNPHGPVAIMRKLIDLDAKITLEDVLAMIKKKKLINEMDGRFLLGFARHVRLVPEHIVLKWILETARKRRLIFFPGE